MSLLFKFFFFDFLSNQKLIIRVSAFLSPTTAQSYSIAKLTNRSFFIDDTLWDRGNWNDHFKELPSTGCKRPDAEFMKACPRGTRHWVS